MEIIKTKILSILISDILYIWAQPCDYHSDQSIEISIIPESSLMPFLSSSVSFISQMVTILTSKLDCNCSSMSSFFHSTCCFGDSCTFFQVPGKCFSLCCSEFHWVNIHYCFLSCSYEYLWGVFAVFITNKATMHSFLKGIYLRVQMQSSSIVCWNSLEIPSFPKWLYHYTFPPTAYDSSSSMSNSGQFDMLAIYAHQYLVLSIF